jgi:hypothetical protein
MASYEAKLEGMRTLVTALQRMMDTIESTYPHDEEGRREDGDNPRSAVDIVEDLCEMELMVAEALKYAQTLVVDDPLDNELFGAAEAFAKHFHNCATDEDFTIWKRLMDAVEAKRTPWYKQVSPGCSMPLVTSLLKCLQRLHGNRVVDKRINCFLPHLVEIERNYKSLPVVPKKEKRKK